jgi:hypothetical protein
MREISADTLSHGGREISAATLSYGAREISAATLSPGQAEISADAPPQGRREDQYPVGRRSELQRQAVEPAVAGLRRRDLTLAPVGSATTVQRVAALERAADSWPDGGAAMMAPTSVQRDSSAGGAVADAPAPGATQASATVASASNNEKDMDELAGKLYDRIRGRLRTELLVDRERAGLLTDWR